MDKQKYGLGDGLGWSYGEEANRTRNFLGMEDGLWYLEETDEARVRSDLIPTTANNNNNNNNTNNHNNHSDNKAYPNHNDMMRCQPMETPMPPNLLHKTNITGMSGGTVTQVDPQCRLVQRGFANMPLYEGRSPNRSSGGVEYANPKDIYDMDQRSFHSDEDNSLTSSSSHSSAGYCPMPVVKLEPPCEYTYQQPMYQPMPYDNLQQSQQEEFQQGILGSIRQEIANAAEECGVSTDPFNWSHQDSIKWVEYTCRKNNMSSDCALLFNVEGKILCRMQLPDFESRVSGEVGKHLHSTLDIWKMTAEFDKPETPIEEKRAFFSQLVDDKTCVRPVDPYQTYSTSPAPSTGSQSSSTMSSDEENFIAAYQAHQEVSHNAPSHVTTPHRGARTGKQTIHLWQFLRELLDDPENYQSCIKWIDRSKGIFKIEDSSKVAKFWGRRKNRPAMNYDKLSRSVRQYYKKGIIKKTEMSKRLVYQFCTPYL
ncbi:transcription factor ets-4-like isoform X2 [Littorina saxatilis]